MYNCSIWYEVEGEWYGELCEDSDRWEGPDFRIGDVFSGVRNTGLKYRNTIEDIFNTLCPPGDVQCLEGKDNLINTLEGKLPQRQPVPKELTQNISDTVAGAIMMVMAYRSHTGDKT